MMIKLMTWFIELQNRFNESRLFKTLMIYVLNWVDDLTSWQNAGMKWFEWKRLNSLSQMKISFNHVSSI